MKNASVWVCEKDMIYDTEREEYKGVMRKTSNKGRELEVAEKGKTKGMHAIYGIIIHSFKYRESLRWCVNA